MGMTAETNKETWRKLKLLTNWNKIKDILLSGLLTQIFQKDAKRSDKKLHFFPLRDTKKPVAKCKKLKRLRFKEPNAALKQWLLTLPVKSLRTLLITWLLITLKNVISFLIFNIWFQVFLINCSPQTLWQLKLTELLGLLWCLVLLDLGELQKMDIKIVCKPGQ